MLDVAPIHSSDAKRKNVRTTQDDIRDDIACASLRQINLLRALSHAALRHLAASARLKKLESRATLVAVGDAPEYFHFLVQGAGKISRLEVNGKESLRFLVKPGDIFGAPGFGPQAIDDTTMFVALKPSTVGRVPARDVEDVLGNTKYLTALGQIVSQRLHQIEERLDDMTMGTVPCRTARVLLRLSDEFPRAMHCGAKVDVLLTQQDLAGMVGATREIVNITLGAFRRDKWVGIHNRYMCIHQRDGLSDLAIC
jgi:CRP/FNR family transcriptional regulator, cyclic AMP receptor protein